MEEKDIATPAEQEEVREPDEATSADEPAGESAGEAAVESAAAAVEPDSEAPAENAAPADEPADEATVETADEPADETAVEAPEEPSAAPGEPGELFFEDKAEEPAVEAARLRAIIEAAVYITDDPLTAQQIADALDQPVAAVQAALDALVAEYEQAEHGVAIREVAEGYKMATKAEHHEAIRSFVKKLQKPFKLSMAALETLAVVAYKQPITAPEIMEIRGVQGAGVLKTLLDRKVITTAGRKNVVGKPILYKTTKDFLVQFGLKNLKELPTLKEFEELARIALSDSEEPEGPASPAEAESAEPGVAETAETEPATEGEAEAEPDNVEEAAEEPAAEREPEAATADDEDEDEDEDEPVALAGSDEPEPKGPQSETGDPAHDSETERQASPKE